MDTSRTTFSSESSVDRCRSGRPDGMAPPRLFKCIVILFLLLGVRESFAQGVAIAESGTPSPNANAILDLQSASGTRGFLVPRMGSWLGGTADGLMYYNTTGHVFYFYNNSTWLTLMSNPMTTGGDIIYGGASGVPTSLANGSLGQVLKSGGGTNSPSWGTVGATAGGTGLTSYAIGDMLYASAATTLSALADVSVGSYLRSGGVTTAPLWSTLTLPNSATTGDLFYASSSNVMGNLLDVAVGRVLVSGGVGSAPSYSATPTLGLNTTTTGQLSLANGGASGASVTIQNNGATTAYNFNLPTGAGTAGQPLLSGGGAATAMTFGTLGVGAGGTGLTSGTSGGILGYTAGGTLASSAALTLNGVVVGGGAGATPTASAASTAAGQVLQTATAGGAPAWVSLGGTASITANAAATNATTVLTGATWTMPANTATVGTVIRIRCNYQFVKTVGPPTLTCNLNVAGASVASFVITSVSAATTVGGYIEGYVTIRTTGAPGTLMSSLDGVNNHGSALVSYNPQTVNIATTNITTTAANVISLTMNMTTAVAGNTLTISQGWVEVVKP